jgi:hypothetical protein
MNIFLAGKSYNGTGLYDEIIARKRKEEGVYILDSFYYIDDWTKKNLPLFGKFMLDSGAFTFMSSGKKVDWNKYVSDYCNFINQYNIDLFFELDIDGIIGYDNVKKIRKTIESKTGKQPIPVWHKRLGKQEFINMCEEYPYVAIGGIVTKEIKQTEHKYFPWFINTAHKHGAKIHGLGYTNLKGLERYHFDSVDSTAWLSGNRFGSVYKFNGKTMVKYQKGDGQRLSDSKAVALNNFEEWLKFQQYAKTHFKKSCMKIRPTIKTLGEII